ncbi:hypothetical protein [Bradyrhizobium sacchari]|uniref:Uncharacterized protein n=1 Tax=Bradyrhizobium sacchari TaxID=1399419 RepID=A0A560JYK2_9BRAD|nr:hypothetical protein [Bradyrhizobium sacchari]TWB62939.1 hypothetical protein FBZ94_103639 [Bradyrhizobium sacchari]TWB76131.1 hypothetical protein FBZ95_104311 [Bradyrhizobium sacchari]
MSPEQAAYEIRQLLRRELDDCERAIRNEDLHRARNELDDAIRKLKRIANSLQ